MYHLLNVVYTLIFASCDAVAIDDHSTTTEISNDRYLVAVSREELLGTIWAFDNPQPPTAHAHSLSRHYFCWAWALGGANGRTITWDLRECVVQLLFRRPMCVRIDDDDVLTYSYVCSQLHHTLVLRKDSLKKSSVDR